MTRPIGARGAGIAACLLLASLAPGLAEPAPVIHYAPGENLEHVDVALIDSAAREIDMAAYVLTDWLILQALTRAARGLLHRTQIDLAREAGVSAVTIRNYENGKTEPNSATLIVLQQTFERAGVEFSRWPRRSVEPGKGDKETEMSKTLITIAAAAGSTG
jgi:DNA-binding XRE family transcriptional regulator